MQNLRLQFEEQDSINQNVSNNLDRMQCLETTVCRTNISQRLPVFVTGHFFRCKFCPLRRLWLATITLVCFSFNCQNGTVANSCFPVIRRVWSPNVDDAFHHFGSSFHGNQKSFHIAIKSLLCHFLVNLLVPPRFVFDRKNLFDIHNAFISKLLKYNCTMTDILFFVKGYIEIDTKTLTIEKKNRK